MTALDSDHKMNPKKFESRPVDPTYGCRLAAFPTASSFYDLFRC